MIVFLPNWRRRHTTKEHPWNLFSDKFNCSPTTSHRFAGHSVRVKNVDITEHSAILSSWHDVRWKWNLHICAPQSQRKGTRPQHALLHRIGRNFPFSGISPRISLRLLLFHPPRTPNPSMVHRPRVDASVFQPGWPQEGGPSYAVGCLRVSLERTRATGFSSQV
jgi:hypothetical protein